LPKDDKSTDNEVMFSAEEIKEIPSLKDIENIS